MPPNVLHATRCLLFPANQLFWRGKMEEEAARAAAGPVHVQDVQGEEDRDKRKDAQGAWEGEEASEKEPVTEDDFAAEVEEDVAAEAMEEQPDRGGPAEAGEVAEVVEPRVRPEAGAAADRAPAAAPRAPRRGCEGPAGDTVRVDMGSWVPLSSTRA